MDPQPTDPNVVFIHPPFATLPDGEAHSEGLTYAHMADHPDWFLDAADFISAQNTNPNAIPYPSFLEPPRGWCPQKKKDLRERGTDSWPEGEEPRLRCTFCRRTYAGVNAKSMWRRHVFEKHKIAMANRRDNTTDRPRGRGTGSKQSLVSLEDCTEAVAEENRQNSTSRTREDAIDSIISIVVAPQPPPDPASHKSRFRATKTIEIRTRPKAGPSIPRQTSPDTSHSEDDAEDDFHSKTPPLTPNASSSDGPQFVQDTSDPITGSPEIERSVIPESPYNPDRTPSFRHVPPPLPIEQPWKHTSPSQAHTRNWSLSMLVPDSPLITASAVSSPLFRVLTPSAKAKTKDQTETPLKSTFLFGRTLAAHPLTFSSSPLKKSVRVRSPASETNSDHQREKHPRSDDTWIEETFPEVAFVNDPFSEVWTASQSPRKVPGEGDSPILHSSAPLPPEAGASSLLEPFKLDDGADLLAGFLESPIRLEGKRMACMLERDEDERPVKRRRMSLVVDEC